MIAPARLTTRIAAFGLMLVSCLTMTAAEGTPGVTVFEARVGQPVAAKCDSGGTIHLVCDSPDGPRYLRSVDGGRTFSSPLEIVDQDSQRPGLQFNVWDLAVSPGGIVHVALGTNAWKLKLPLEEWGFFYTRLDRGATSFAPLVNVNRKPSEGFSLAADEKGNVAACWLADKLYANVSHDNGASFGPIVEIDASFNPCNCCTTSSTYAADGRLAILYREETNDERDMFLALWNQDGGEVTRTKISKTPWKIDACPMTYYAVATTADGFAAAWPTRGRIYFARLDKVGEVLPPGEVKTPGESGMRTGLVTLSDREGNTLVAWKKDGTLGWQLYDKRGRPKGNAGSTPSPGSGASGVVTNDDRFVLFR
ncbi:MAG TPA: sialidase family protein [Pirellulales bacterium]|jgi:hypothetical protein|nr:sialidase family protein [Pirellulales bacterium]